MKEREELKTEIDKIIKLTEKVLETETTQSHSSSTVNETKFHECRIAALSWLSRIFGSDHIFYEHFKTEVTHATASRTRRGLGILQAARKELDTDWLETTRTMATKALFADMLKLAKAQVDLGQNHAAIILIGSLLEEMLKKLAFKSGIKLYNEIQGKAVAKRGLQLSGEVYKKRLYERKDNKQILAIMEIYLKVCENPAEPVKETQVRQAISWMQSFIAFTSTTSTIRLPFN